MDIQSINQQLSQRVDQAGNEVSNKISSGDLTNPANLLQAQFAIQQYSTLVGYQSAVLKAVKDMLTGIIQKI